MSLKKITTEESNNGKFNLINWKEPEENQETKSKIIKIAGCRGVHANYTLDKEPTKEEIQKIRDNISQSFGILKYYQLWFSKPINSWRLVFYRQ